MLRALSVLAATMLIGSAAIADQGRFKQEVINYYTNLSGDESKRKRAPSATEIPWWGPGCATLVACGMRLRWDDRLKIWRPYAR